MAEEKKNREEFIHLLESVQAGLAARETTALQSTCFVFDHGWINSYNDECRARVPSGLDKDICGAVPATKLLNLLSRLTEEDIYLDFDEQKLSIRTPKGRRSYFNLDSDIKSKYNEAGEVKNWTELPSGFSEAVGTVQECAKTKADFECVVVHVTPEFVEAGDGFQLCRWYLATGFTQPVLMRKEFLKHVTTLGMVEFSEAKNWIHFRNKEGVEVALRRYAENYPDWEGRNCLRAAGEKTSIPKGFAIEADIGAIFSSEIRGNDRVTIEVRPGKTRLTSQGVTGGYKSPWREIAYTGEPFTFQISPGMLSGLIDKYSEHILGQRTLSVVSGNFAEREPGSWIYVAWLAPPPQEKEEKEEETLVAVGAEEEHSEGEENDD